VLIAPSLRHCFTASLFLAVSVASAQDRGTYPTKPIRVLVAQAAGGPTDVVTRLYASRLTELLGQQVVVDNRPGAGGSIACELTAHAAADGYTLCAAANGTVAIAPHMIKLSYSVSRDLVPVALIGNSPLALMVHPGLPAASVKDLIALAKARPGTINFGSSGQAGTGHLAGEMLKMMAGIDITHVPYKGAAPALIAVAAGESHILISGLSSGLPFIRSKQVRAMAVTSPKRLPVLPDVPAIAETVPGYEAGSWYAVLARTGTPRGVIDRLSQESIRTVNDPDIKSKLVAAGVDPEPLTPEQLAKKMREETERWGKVVKAAGVRMQ
jgi:tripartite-type tricarboxylate transporter receptor subunit TctC